MGHTIDAATLQGLSAGQLAGDGGPVRFRVPRDAGTLRCDGIVRRGRGTGECTFVANAAFADALAARGIGRPTPDEQFSMALNDIGIAYVDDPRPARATTAPAPPTSPTPAITASPSIISAPWPATAIASAASPR